MTVGFIQNMMPFAERKVAYAADITYGTNSEFGFDYLRDNMAVSKEGLVQRSHCLRDRGRGRLDPDRRGADAADHLRRARDRGDDLLRLRAHRQGARPARRRRARARRARTRPSSPAPTTSTTRSTRPSRRRRPRSTRSSARSGSRTSTTRRNVQLVNHLIQSLKAESLYQRDVDYVIQDGEVKIVDEFTGRIMEGRRWSDGPPPGGRGEGGRPDPGGERHARDDHAPELLPPLREARRHDRYRQDRGEGVRRDLQPPRRRDPDERPGHAARRERLHLQDEGGEVRGRDRRHQGAATRRASRCSSARSRSRPPSTSPS